MTYNEEKKINQSNYLELADKYIKTLTITDFHMFNKLSKYMKNTQIELLKMKTTISEKKILLDKIKGRLAITQEKISKFECITMETI